MPPDSSKQQPGRTNGPHGHGHGPRARSLAAAARCRCWLKLRSKGQAHDLQHVTVRSAAVVRRNSVIATDCNSTQPPAPPGPPARRQPQAATSFEIRTARRGPARARAVTRAAGELGSWGIYDAGVAPPFGPLPLLASRQWTPRRSHGRMRDASEGQRGTKRNKRGVGVTCSSLQPCPALDVAPTRSALAAAAHGSPVPRFAAPHGTPAQLSHGRPASAWPPAGRCCMWRNRAVERALSISYRARRSRIAPPPPLPQPPRRRRARHRRVPPAASCLSCRVVSQRSEIVAPPRVVSCAAAYRYPQPGQPGQAVWAAEPRAAGPRAISTTGRTAGAARRTRACVWPRLGRSAAAGRRGGGARALAVRGTRATSDEHRGPRRPGVSDVWPVCVWRVSDVRCAMCDVLRCAVCDARPVCAARLEPV